MAKRFGMKLSWPSRYGSQIYCMRGGFGLILNGRWWSCYRDIETGKWTFVRRDNAWRAAGEPMSNWQTVVSNAYNARMARPYQTLSHTRLLPAHDPRTPGGAERPSQERHGDNPGAP